MMTHLSQGVIGAAALVLLSSIAMADNDAQLQRSNFVLAQNQAQPTAVELAMWDFAVTSGDPVEIARFLELYPDSQFAGDAKVLMRALAPEQSATDTITESAPDSDQANTSIVFDQATITDPNTGSKVSLMELINGSPLFPPVEGLPEEYWKSVTCSNCHQWEKDNLCTQAEFYVNQESGTQERGEHPYGGFFKNALNSWASDGCQ